MTTNLTFKWVGSCKSDTYHLSKMGFRVVKVGYGWVGRLEIALEIRYHMRISPYNSLKIRLDQAQNTFVYFECSKSIFTIMCIIKDSS